MNEEKINVKVLKSELEYWRNLYSKNKVVYSKSTDIGVINLLENGLLTNTNEVTITDVPLDLKSFEEAISSILYLYNYYGAMSMSYEQLIYEVENLMKESKFLDMNTHIDKWVVIAKCSDGDIIIHKNGDIAFDIEIADEIAKEHQNMGAEIEIMRYDNYKEIYGK